MLPQQVAKFSVLIADDSETDRFFYERALCHSTRLQVVGSVRNGAEAIQYLAGSGRFSNRKLWPLPDLLLLDLKMPTKDGFEVLEWLQNGKEAPRVKVVVLSSSPLEQDITRSRRLGVNAFFTKNSELYKLEKLVKELEDFLLNPRHSK